MLFMLLCVQAVVQVVSQEMPSPPLHVHVDKWLLTWTPTEETNVTYTVQYLSFRNDVWRDVPACVQTPFNSCNVAFTKAESEHGCVLLRVRAERHELSSRPVKACSRHGDSCSPNVSLTARSGSLTVYLSSDHSMAHEHGDHVKHRVYYGKEGESLQKYKDAISSVTISNLEEGQRYCAKVQYVYFGKPMGLESCTQCEVIPKSKFIADEHKPKQTVVIIIVLVVLFLACLISVIAYVLIIHPGRIKRWLRPPCKIPDHFFFKSFAEHHVLRSSTIEEDHFDAISVIE
ncbi:hypothetical protein JOB18_034550 [Solea senegalensis]|uniref:Interferon gamma receptor 2 n=1 Tax=Solea senegalensis TaxID=28829 RepID=A0AAV6RCK1_SOLSE|nr:uncharacterized protein LOC122765129 [Solea senegalensis]KAG7503256.1 interferon gamma receptor 2 precursor [Solea senegalensis]KAG7503257.1 hypothetical protein JOB18_034550 [Solea senegalensis]